MRTDVKEGSEVKESLTERELRSRKTLACDDTHKLRLEE